MVIYRVSLKQATLLGEQQHFFCRNAREAAGLRKKLGLGKTVTIKAAIPNDKDGLIAALNELAKGV